MLEKVKKNLINIPGKRLDKKYLVLESDDWGTIRTPNREVFNKLVSRKLVSENDPFSRYDCLESEADLSALFDVLSGHRDMHLRPAVITANTVVCNPDFSKIKESGYTQYFHEPFTETFKKYSAYGNTFSTLSQGIDSGIYMPQYHAREHLNVHMWLNLLKKGNEDFLYAFGLECFSIDYKDTSNRRNNIMAAYDYNTQEELKFIEKSIAEGLKIFEDIFNKNSVSAIAPCYVWDNAIENAFRQHGVYYLQGSKFQHVPVAESSKFKKVFHYNGQINKYEQTYFLRNGLFEPSVKPNIDWVSKCLESIAIAFKWKKPAIIGTHRLNYIGSVFPENRDRNLKLLNQLLTAVKKHWPDVEFVSTAELAEKYKEI